MTKLNKISLKKFCFPVTAVAFCIAITWKSEARRTQRSEIYSTLTTDTIPQPKKADTIPPKTDTAAIIRDTIPPGQRPDTLSLKFSKDTLDAPVVYEAADSGVLMVKEKKFYLYGNTKTTYKDAILTAPKLEMNQETNVVTAYNGRDSAGNILTRAKFKQGAEQGFESDTISFNFKSQRGLTVNTYTKQQDMFVQAEVMKKVNPSTAFAKRMIMTTCDYDDPHFGFVANKGEFINNKVAITGPIHPEFEGVPIPIYLPFGIFPLNQGRHSGLLQVTPIVTDQFGLGLENIGYYHVINENADVTVRGTVYSYGGWNANVISNYIKRYRYNGTFSFNLQHNKFNFKGDPDYNLVKTFFISWSHSMNQKARPGTNFSASVNAGSTRYNQYLVNSPNRNFQNQLASSINYSKTWGDGKYNLTTSANHNQNSNSHDVRISLPDAGFTVTTFYPFQRKELIGSPKWYEKIGVGYSTVLRNQVAFNDTLKNSISSILDTMQWGAQHRFPISMSLPPVGPLLVNPFVSYEETWLTQRIHREWNPTTKQVDTTYDKKGLFIDRQMSFGFGVNTNIYGTVQLKHSRIIAIRHVIRPNINFNYKPNLSSKYYDVIQVDSSGRKDVLPQIIPGRNLFSSYGYGRFGGITFGVDNNLEMKVRSRKDTGANAIKKVRLIDGFGFSSGYNFLQDSLKLLPFNLYFRTTLFEKISITAQALYNPYKQDSLGRYVNKFVWQGDRFSLGRISSGSISMSTSFQSKPRKGTQSSAPTPTRVTDPNVLADQERLQDYIRRNPAEFVDFNIPWSFSLSFSLFFSQQLQPDHKYKTVVTSNLSFNNSFSLTPKWNFSTNGYFDLNTMKLTMYTMSVSRDMHCWQMSVNVTPIGLYRSFSITINPKSSILQDLRVNRTRTFSNY
jgi:LPS-assembly protein